MATMIDVNVPRFNQACVAVLTGVAFIAQWWPLVGVVAGILLLTRWAGPTYGLFTQAYLRLIKPHVHGEIETERAAPPRFAQLVGVIVLSVATFAFVFDADVVGWVLTLAVTALATLAAVTKICVGCLIYDRAVGS